MCDNEFHVGGEEKDMEEESVKLKQVNNSNFVPSMHSRYITEES